MTELDTTIRLVISRQDAGQLLDGLAVLAEQWEYTQRYMDGENVGTDVCIRECSNAHEAQSIAAHYRRIAESIEQQIVVLKTHS